MNESMDAKTEELRTAAVMGVVFSDNVDRQ